MFSHLGCLLISERILPYLVKLQHNANGGSEEESASESQSLIPRGGLECAEIGCMGESVDSLIFKQSSLVNALGQS